MCKYMYDCSYILCANMKYEVVNGYKCTLLRGAILLLQVNPEFEECFKPEWSQLVKQNL